MDRMSGRTKGKKYYGQIALTLFADCEYTHSHTHAFLLVLANVQWMFVHARLANGRKSTYYIAFMACVCVCALRAFHKFRPSLHFGYSDARFIAHISH